MPIEDEERELYAENFHLYTHAAYNMDDMDIDDGDIGIAPQPSQVQTTSYTIIEGPPSQIGTSLAEQQGSSILPPLDPVNWEVVEDEATSMIAHSRAHSRSVDEPLVRPVQLCANLCLADWYCVLL